MPCCARPKVPPSTPERPLVLGVANGAEPQRARLHHPKFGYRRRAIVWVTGDGVADMVTARHLTLLEEA